METLTSKDTECLLVAIQELYTLHDLSSFGVKALTIINQLVPSDIPEFHITDFQQRLLVDTVFLNHPGWTAQMLQTVHCHFAEHPIVQNMPHTLNGAHKLSDFISEKKLHQLEGLYQQFLRQIGCEDQMIMFFAMSKSQCSKECLQSNNHMVGISLNRSQRNFTERDRLILNLLRPHLFQAYCNAQRYQQLQQNLTQLKQSLESLSLIILNASGQIQFITAQASQYLQLYFNEAPQLHQLPNHLWGWIKHQISAVKDADIVKTCLPLRVEHADKQLVIHLVIEPSAERYLLLLEEQTLSILPLLELLGLSVRETEVLFWIIRGEDNRAIAHHLGVHLSTVRKHLESVYRKLGVQSRTEAIAQALAKLGILTR